MRDPIGVCAGGTLGRKGPIPLGSLGYIELLTAVLREKFDPPIQNLNGQILVSVVSIIEDLIAKIILR